MTWAELIAAAVLLAVLGALTVSQGSAMIRAKQDYACSGGQLKNLALALKIYASEDASGRFPPLTQRYRRIPEGYESIPGLWLPEISALYPDYLPSLWAFVCTSEANRSGIMQDGAPWAGDPMRVTDASYLYAGFALRDADDLARVRDERVRPNARTGVPVNAAFARGVVDMDAPIGEGAARLHRLQNGAGRFLVTDTLEPARAAEAEAAIPLMWDRTVRSGALRLPHFSETGACVVFMDGHGAAIRYPDAFPIDARSARVLGMIGTSSWYTYQ